MYRDDDEDYKGESSMPFMSAPFMANPYQQMPYTMDGDMKQPMMPYYPMPCQCPCYMEMQKKYRDFDEEDYFDEDRPIPNYPKYMPPKMPYPMPYGKHHYHHHYHHMMPYYPGHMYPGHMFPKPPYYPGSEMKKRDSEE
jgi:hypothetical protein